MIVQSVLFFLVGISFLLSWFWFILFKRDQYWVLSLLIRKNIWFLSFASWPTELIDRFDPPELFSTTVPPPESFCAASEASILIRFSSKTRAQIGTNFACILIGQKGLLIFDEVLIPWNFWLTLLRSFIAAWRRSSLERCKLAIAWTISYSSELTCWLYDFLRLIKNSNFIFNKVSYLMNKLQDGQK